MWLALSWVSLAMAQAPTFNFALPPRGEQREVVAEVTSTRFEGDASVAGPALKPGDKVEVIIEVEGQVRFRLGTRYGWVPASALATPGAGAAGNDTPGAAPMAP